MDRNRTENANMLQAEIRRQFGSPGTARFLHSLPAFQLQDETPDRFVNLLSELDRAEAEQSGRDGR